MGKTLFNKIIKTLSYSIERLFFGAVSAFWLLDMRVISQSFVSCWLHYVTPYPATVFLWPNTSVVVIERPVAEAFLSNGPRIQEICFDPLIIISLVQCNIVVTTSTNFSFEKIEILRFGRGCGIMELQQHLNLTA